MTVALSDLFDPNASPAQSEHRLRQAYVNVFVGRGQPTEEDKNLVLVDMALQSGFLTVTPDEITSEQLHRAEGGRKLFGHVLRMVTPTPKEMDGLLGAVTRELAAQNGEI